MDQTYRIVLTWYFLRRYCKSAIFVNIFMLISRGRARGPAGFDAPFNMGSAKGEIEWNGIFQGKYLTDYIK